MIKILRQRAPLIALCLACFVVGIIFAYFVLGFRFHSGLLSLIGAFLGAAVTIGVLAAMVRADESHNADETKQLVIENVEFLKRQANDAQNFLDNTREDDFKNFPFKLTVEATIAELGSLLDAVALFDQLSPFKGIARVESRLALQELAQVIAAVKSYLEREKSWLQKNQTEQVLESALTNAANDARDIVAAAERALEQLRNNFPTSLGGQLFRQVRRTAPDRRGNIS